MGKDKEFPGPNERAHSPESPANSPRQQLGRDALAYFKTLLGGPPAGWTLERASFTARALEFSLVKDSRRLEFDLHARLSGAAPLGGCGLRLRGDPEGLPAHEREFVETLSAVLAGTSFSALLARLRRDGLLYSDPDGSRVPSRLDRYFRRNDHTGDFWKFVYPQWRCLEEKVSLGAHWVRINYSTLECRLSNPNPETPSLRFFADEAADDGAGGCRDVEVVMTEADVVGGRTQEILGRALESAAREDKPAFIHLNTTCMPELLGDTPVPFLSHVEGELGVPVLWTSKTRPGGPLYAAWIDRLLDRIKSAAERDPRAVLLAGAMTDAARAEAEELLSALGLRVVGELFPNLDFRRAPDMGTASAVVWLDPVGWETISDAAFLRRGLAVVRYHPPYGAQGARAWLERVVSVLGLDGVEAGWARLEESRAAELEVLRAKCRKHTVLLAGDSADVELLTSSGRAFGFSVAGLLCELGFNVRCLVWGAGAGARRPMTASGAGTVEFVPFTTRAQLDRELGRGVDLVFTHLNHDRRLWAHGLPGFTEAAFEPGLDGLLRSGRRLLAKCRARPFARHRGALTGWTP